MLICENQFSLLRHNYLSEGELTKWLIFNKTTRGKIRTLVEIPIWHNCKEIYKQENKVHTFYFSKKGCKCKRGSMPKFGESF